MKTSLVSFNSLTIMPVTDKKQHFINVTYPKYQPSSNNTGYLLAFKGKYKTINELMATGREVLKNIPQLQSNKIILNYLDALEKEGIPLTAARLTLKQYVNYLKVLRQYLPQISKLRKSVNKLNSTKQYFKIIKNKISLQDFLTNIKKSCLEEGVGTCEHFCVFVVDDLIKKGISNFKVIEALVLDRNKSELSSAMSEHVFVVLHNGKERDFTMLKEWKDNAVVADAWMGKVYPAKKYIKVLKNKILRLDNSREMLYLEELDYYNRKC